MTHGARPDVPLDPCAQRVDVRAEHDVVRGRPRGFGQRARPPRLGTGPRGPGSRQQSRRARFRSDRELGCTLPGGRSGLETTAPAGPLRDLVQVGDDGLVGLLRCCRTVPRPPVDIPAVDQHVGQRPVHRPALAARGRAVDGGAHQWVAKRHHGVDDGDETRVLTRGDVLCRRAERERGLAHDRRAARVVGGRDHQERLCARGKPLELVEEGPLDPLGQRELPRQGRQPAELIGRECARELDEGERVSARAGHQALEDVGRDRQTCHCRQQGAGIGRVELPEGEVRQFSGVEPAYVAVASREQEGQPLGLQSARHEQQGCGGGFVEPLRVVGDREHGCLLGGLPEQAQGGEEDQEPIGLALFLSERPAQRSCLRGRQPVDEAQHRAQQTLQGRVRQRGLRLDARGPQHGETVRIANSSVEQRRLAHARQAVQDQHGPP